MSATILQLAQAPSEASREQRSPGDLDQALAVFLAERTRLVRIARRVTGSAETAEDVVQEVWLRWQRTDHRQVRNASAFLATATTHFAINVIQSARSRHETVAATPLADLADSAGDPAARVESTEAVTGAMELLLLKLNPTERAVYVLRKSFDYPYQQIADLLQIQVAHARQLVLRSQTKLTHGRTRPISLEAHRQLVRAFLAAAQTGEMATLEELLVRAVGDRTRCQLAPVVRHTRGLHLVPTSATSS